VAATTVGWFDVETDLDRLVAMMMARASLRFAVATDEIACDAAWRLRGDAVVAAGWRTAAELDRGRERDADDAHAVLVVGWDGDVPVATGRIVAPPWPLPTEVTLGRYIEPIGALADVGRMVVDRTYQAAHHGTFVMLLAALYLEVRALGFTVACGMMTPTVRGLARHLGITLEQLGPDREYWGVARAPVRFSVSDSASTLVARWGD
jgi:hypothetical protein